MNTTVFNEATGLSVTRGEFPNFKVSRDFNGFNISISFEQLIDFDVASDFLEVSGLFCTTSEEAISNIGRGRYVQVFVDEIFNPSSQESRFYVHAAKWALEIGLETGEDHRGRTIRGFVPKNGRTAEETAKKLADLLNYQVLMMAKVSVLDGRGEEIFEDNDTTFYADMFEVPKAFLELDGSNEMIVLTLDGKDVRLSDVFGPEDFNV